MTISRELHMHINVRQLTGLSTLAGKSGGLRDFPKFMNVFEEAPEGAVIILDWSDVELATASYFGATVVPLVRMMIGGDLNCYIVLTGLNRNCIDELKLVLELQNYAVLVGTQGKGRTVNNVEVMGTLDPAYRQTWEAVRSRNTASASDLHRNYKTQKIGKTAWINRLTNLNRLRLLKKQRIGREYVYEVVA